MPRRSPGQPKIRPKPTASDRARRQRTRLMQAQQVDSEQLLREKPNEPKGDLMIVTGQSGDTSDGLTGQTQSKAISIEEYKNDVQLEGFAVSDQPKFFASDNETDDIAQVQGLSLNSNYKYSKDKKKPH